MQTTRTQYSLIYRMPNGSMQQSRLHDKLEQAYASRDELQARYPGLIYMLEKQEAVTTHSSVIIETNTPTPN